MFLSKLHAKAALLGYAILSLPYVALGLEIQSRKVFKEHLGSRSDLIAMPDGSGHLGASYTKFSNLAIQSSTVHSRATEVDQEEWYFRNFTLVGKKSDGLNITQYDMENYPSRLAMTSLQRLDAGDVTLKIVASAGIGLAIVGVACVAVSAVCAATIAANISSFLVGVSTGVAAAVVAFFRKIIGSSKGNSGADNKSKRDFTDHEDFGCIYENSYAGACTNQALSQPLWQQVLDNDGNTEDTPLWSCYQVSDSNDGTVFGFYSHCFGDDDACNLQCGVGNPEIDEPEHQIPTPS